MKEFYRFQYWSEVIFGLLGLAGSIVILVFRAIWENTIVLILVLWGFVLVLVLAWVLIRAVKKAKEKKQGTTPGAEADAWRLPGSGNK